MSNSSKNLVAGRLHLIFYLVKVIRIRERPPGPRLERCLAFFTVAGQQPADPALGDPVAAGCLSLGQSLGYDSGDYQACL